MLDWQPLFQSLNYVQNHFLDTNKRLFWGYLLSSFVLVCWVWWPSRRKHSLLNYIFPKRIWLHVSAKQDYAIWLINSLLKLFVILPLLFTVAPIAIKLSFTLEGLFGDIPPVTLNPTHAMLYFTLLLFVLDDFSRFLLHLLLHKIPWLWQLHKVHHSAEVMTPITVYRIHPLESVLYAMRLVTIQGIALGLGFYLFSYKISVLDVLGANIGVFLFNLFGANLRHSHVRLSWPKWLENWLISPLQHQVHHSNAIKHRDKNLGSALAIWDRMFGSLVRSDEVDTPLSFGLGKRVYGTITQVYLDPIIEIFQAIKTKLSRLIPSG